MPPRRQESNQTTEAEPVLRVARPQLDREIEERIALGQELLNRQFQPHHDDVRALEGDFITWDEFNEQLLRSRFSLPRVANEYRRMRVGFGGQLAPDRELYYLRSGLSSQIRKLASIRQQLPLYESEVAEASESKPLTGVIMGSKIFIVHGHDSAVKLEVAEFLQRITGERPIILHEMAASGSRTVIEKFEGYASEAGFAVVLLTADDVGSAKGAATLNARARQNVVLELGFFFGKLGRSRVVALYEDGIELPSDISGVLYIPLSGNWHTDLAKELRAAGIAIDPSKLV
jgi:predicted nucleotide-binding protein